MKNWLPALVLVLFGAFSVEVVLQHGYTGFLTLAWREPWGMQMLLDLCISAFLVAVWIRRDAREQGIVAAPYLVTILFLGSIGALAYLVHRALKAHLSRRPVAVGAPGVTNATR